MPVIALFSLNIWPGSSALQSLIVRECLQAEYDYYYPIHNDWNEALHKRYRALANAEARASIVARPSEHRYYNLNQVVGAAHSVAKHIPEG